MKKVAIGFGVFIGLIGILILGVNLYFTDARLKDLIIPQVKELTGKTIGIDELSLHIVSTFPNAGLVMKGVFVEGDKSTDTLAFIAELEVDIKLKPLLSSHIEFDKIIIDRPQIAYLIDAKGSTNLDSILEKLSTKPSSESQEQADSSKVPFQLNITELLISKAQVVYEDAKSKTRVDLKNLDINLELNYAETINSKASFNIGSLSVFSEGSNLVSNLQIGLEQQSNIDLKKDILSLSSGSLSIQGLDLRLSGDVSKLTQPNPVLNLALESSSKNFGTLLALVPKDYQDQIKGLETKGTLALKGTIKGPVGGNEIPRFEFFAGIGNGLLKYPGFEPVQDIQLDFTATNDQIVIQQLKAAAGVNTFQLKGVIKQILTPNITFQVNGIANADLATFSKYYDLKQVDIGELRGAVNVTIQANGKVNEIEKTSFNAVVKLTNGLLRYNYPGVSKPFENIFVDIVATQSRVDIKKFTAKASRNNVDLTGYLQNPLIEKQRTISINGKVNADLSSIKEFYPIKEDTLLMHGLMNADIRLSANLNNVENANAVGRIKLQNGYFKHKSMPKAVENVQVDADVSRNTIRVNSASLKTGSNQLSAKGLISNYLKEKPSYTLQIASTINLAEVKDFVDIKSFVNEIAGIATTNLTLKGLGTDINTMKYTGLVTVKNGMIKHDSLPRPVQNVQVELNFSEKDVTLKNLSLNLGKSDVKLNGQLKDYLIFVDSNRKGTSNLAGTYNSTVFNLDELINWSEKTESSNEPVLIELPQLTSSVKAQINSLVAMGVTMTNLKANAQTNPKKIQLTNASVNVFGGSINGAFTWDIPKPDRTKVVFNGQIDNVRAEAFFKEYKLTGKDSKLDQYVSGGLSIIANYSSDLEATLSPDLKTSNGTGSFGMTKSRLKNHPTQIEIANLLGAKELENIALDDWKATYSLKNGVLDLRDMKLTSGNFGAELNGTHDLVNDKMDFKMSLFLPASFADKLAKWITLDATKALTRKDGSLYVPLKLTGSSAKPKVVADMDAIKPIVEKYLKDKVVDKVEGAIKDLLKF